MDDLYQASSSNSSIVSTTSTSSGWFALPDFSNFDINQFANSLNTFAVAWSIFFSVVFMCNFFYFRVLYTWGEIPKEKKGVESIVAGRRIWITYLMVWPFFYLFVYNVNNLNSLWAPLAIAVYFIKIVLLDASTMPVFKDILGPVAKIFGSPLLEIPGLLFPPVATFIGSIIESSSESSSSAIKK